jgi:hypothetical protein
MNRLLTAERERIGSLSWLCALMARMASAGGPRTAAPEKHAAPLPAGPGALAVSGAGPRAARLREPERTQQEPKPSQVLCCYRFNLPRDPTASTAAATAPAATASMPHPPKHPALTPPPLSASLCFCSHQAANAATPTRTPSPSGSISSIALLRAASLRSSACHSPLRHNNHNCFVLFCVCETFPVGMGGHSKPVLAKIIGFHQKRRRKTDIFLAPRILRCLATAPPTAAPAAAAQLPDELAYLGLVQIPIRWRPRRGRPRVFLADLLCCHCCTCMNRGRCSAAAVDAGPLSHSSGSAGTTAATTTARGTPCCRCCRCR